MVARVSSSLKIAEELGKTRNALNDLQYALQRIYGKHTPVMLIYGSPTRREAFTEMRTEDLCLRSVASLV
jgi:hypothetical protein